MECPSSLGGQMRWVSRLPRLNKWNRITDWRMTQIQKLASVQFIPSTRMSTQDVLD
jgi:hypothetical protein